MSDEVPAPVQRLLDAIDAQDADAFVAAFEVDGFVDDWGRVFKGHTKIRQWSDGELIGVAATFTGTEVSEAGNPLTILTQVGGNGFNGPSHFRFEYDAERVISMTITA